MAGSLRFLFALCAAGDALAGHAAAWLLENLTKSGRTAQSLRRLRNLGHISATTTGALDRRVVRIAPAGRAAALGGLDPDVLWRRSWDRRWRMVAFDIPEIHLSLRTRLRRRLHAQRFGWLQNSVWISPDALDAVRAELGELGIAPDSLLLLEAFPAGGESHEAIVSSAWDFVRAGRAWSAYRNILKQRPASAGSDLAPWRKWIDAEQQAWRSVARRDPFLPEVLLPKDYTGREIWAERAELLADAGRLLREAAERASTG